MTTMATRSLLAFLGFYRRWLSPMVHALSPTGCRFRPTCSEYAAEAVKTYGAARGTCLAMRRLMRCHPFGASGFDPVPLPRAHGHLAAETVHDPLP